MYFNRISTAPFIALNKKGVKTVLQLHYWQCKIDTASIYIGYSEKGSSPLSI